MTNIEFCKDLADLVKKYLGLEKSVCLQECKIDVDIDNYPKIQLKAEKYDIEEDK